MGNQNVNPDFNSLLNIVSELSKQKLSDKAESCIMTIEFVNKVIKYGILNSEISKLIGIRCNKNLKFGKRVCKLLLRYVNDHDENSVILYSQLAQGILSNCGDETDILSEWILGFPDLNELKLVLGENRNNELRIN